MNEDRIKGMLYGVCLGDALGVPFEFRFHKKKYTGNLKDYYLERRTRFGNNIKFDYGQVSDDSEMTIILARHISKYGFNKEKLIMDYIEWCNNSSSSLGINTRLLFKNIKTIKGYQAHYLKMDPNNQSNGCLMRCTSLVFIDEKYWIEECKITNPHAICIEINIIYLTMVKHALLNKSKRLIIKYGLKRCINEDIKKVFEEAINKKDRDIDVSKGWIMHAFYCAIYSLIHFENYTDAMFWIMSKDGDTDTNGAIAGGLLGAYYGYKNLYKEQKDNINVMINCTTLGGNKPRPEKYKPNNLDIIIEKLVEKYC